MDRTRPPSASCSSRCSPTAAWPASAAPQTSPFSTVIEDAVDPCTDG
jgi:hypothetical protein